MQRGMSSGQAEQVAEDVLNNPDAYSGGGAYLPSSPGGGGYPSASGDSGGWTGYSEPGLPEAPGLLQSIPPAVWIAAAGVGIVLLTSRN